MSILVISASDGLGLSHLNMLLVENVPEGVSRIGALEGNWVKLVIGTSQPNSSRSSVPR
jgi:hypothetical protein